MSAWGIFSFDGGEVRRRRSAESPRCLAIVTETLGRLSVCVGVCVWRCVCGGVCACVCWRGCVGECCGVAAVRVVGCVGVCVCVCVLKHVCSSVRCRMHGRKNV